MTTNAVYYLINCQFFTVIKPLILTLTPSPIVAEPVPKSPRNRSATVVPVPLRLLLWTCATPELIGGIAAYY